MKELDYSCNIGSCKGAGHYYVRGVCGNCGSEFKMKLSQGHEKPSSFLSARCPTCGCNRVSGQELLTPDPLEGGSER
jgi:DNA-directed RNA polymerase subunit RPC12/RpoP